jgi:copper resistance protein C
MRRAVVAAAAFMAAAFSFTGTALAHAFLDHAQPAVGSTVHGSPAEVKLWFTQRLEPAFSTVRVLDSGGAQVDAKDKRVDPGDKTLLRVSLPKLPPGKYRVVWRILSVDTHPTEGDYTFEIAP